MQSGGSQTGNRDIIWLVTFRYHCCYIYLHIYIYIYGALRRGRVTKDVISTLEVIWLEEM